jgi:putative FmdB family regulatory protein
MAVYEYICLACEHPFEERRPMTSGGVDTALACPSCGSERLRRRFSFFASTASSGEVAPRSGGGCCGGSCGCGS